MYFRLLAIFKLVCICFLLPVTVKAVSDDYTDSQELEDIHDWKEENKEEMEDIQLY